MPELARPRDKEKKEGVQQGQMGFGPIGKGNKEFLYIFNSFQYLPTKYDSNSNFE
jgi:hypothetical protein